MYFTDTPSLNSLEAIMKRPPGSVRRGGGKYRSRYKYTKADCDCRFCLYYRKKTGCTAAICPVMNIRIECGAATLADAVKDAFKETKHPALKRRIAQTYSRKDDTLMKFQTNRHKQIFEEQLRNLRKPSKKAVAVLYLLTSDKALWLKAKRHLSGSGKVDIKAIHLGDISPDGYALWKAVKELQTGEKQISLCELADNSIISDHAFRLIVQAIAIAHFGTAVLTDSEVRHV